MAINWPWLGGTATSASDTTIVVDNYSIALPASLVGGIGDYLGTSNGTRVYAAPRVKGGVALAPPVVRKPLSPPIDTDSMFEEQERATLTEAEKVLGYHRPKKPEEKPLYRALYELGIEPFDQATVNRYKEAKRVEANERSGHWVSWRWEEVRLDGFAGEIPGFVLERAIQIKKKCPQVILMVDYLVEHPDPFLVARLGDEVFYVDVWDEPNFKAKRAV